MYDFVIVGAGLAGCTFAYLAKNSGFKCLVVEKKDVIGGTCATEKINGITVHKYGAHIFKTSDKFIWDFANKIAAFDFFVNTPKARYKDRLFSLPINMNTFHELWGVVTPEEAQMKIEEQKQNFTYIDSLERFVLSEVGKDIYEYLIKGYTEKQWGIPCSKLSPEIMRRIPIRMTFNNNYYNSAYQGIPSCGYSEFMERMLEGIETVTSTDFIKKRSHFEDMARTVVYTGALDELFSYVYGDLEYRSLLFDHKEIHDINNFQGVAVVNYTCLDVPYTRLIEHRHFSKTNPECGTVITYETPCKYHRNGLSDRYYPMTDKVNLEKYSVYRSMIPDNYIILGRLAEYRYIDMAETIESAMKSFESVTGIMVRRAEL